MCESMLVQQCMIRMESSSFSSEIFYVYKGRSGASYGRMCVCVCPGLLLKKGLIECVKQRCEMCETVESELCGLKRKQRHNCLPACDLSKKKIRNFFTIR